MAEKPSRGRILLALDASQRSRAALALAAALAAELDAELSGLFVEDIDLLHLSSLPFAREVGFLSAISRPLAMDEMEQAMRREAETVRRLLGEAAARGSLRWSFQVVRGRIASELFTLAGDLDLVVLGKRARKGIRSLGSAMMQAADQTYASGPVVAVFDGTESAQRALQLAMRQARQAGTELRLMVPASTDREFIDRSNAATAILSSTGQPTPICRRVSAEGLGEIAEAACSAGASVLVLNGDGRLRSGEGFATLLNEIDCPVVLVG